MLVLTVGHSLTRGNEGFSANGLPPECYFWRGWIPKIRRELHKLQIPVKVFHRREEIPKWVDRQLDLVKRINKLTDVELVVDLHYNSPPDKSGIMCVCGLDKRGNKAADLLGKVLSKESGLRYRGIWNTDISSKGSELYLLTRVKYPTVVLEPFSASIRSDIEATVKILRSGRFSTAIANAYKAYIAQTDATEEESAY